MPVETATLCRIFSMTKPVTSVAAMMLYEEGAFELMDPVSRFIPSFGDVRVYVGGSDLRPVTVPAAEPVRIWHLLTHTSGFHRVNTVDAMYRNAGFEWTMPPALDLAGCCDAWAALLLLFQPGAEWNYSVSTDVLGRLVEVVSGQRLDEFFTTRILGPLGMTDTAFAVPDGELGRLAALYVAGPGNKPVRDDKLGAIGRRPPQVLMGGGGLISSAADYHRFTQMLLHRPDSPAGELEGVTLLSPRTVAYMTRNHLPGGADLDTFGRSLFPDAPFTGTGFGLGFAVVLDATGLRTVASEGEFSWGGAANTFFFVDRAEQLTACFYTQLLPTSAHRIRPQLRQMVYQALTG